MQIMLSAVMAVAADTVITVMAVAANTVNAVMAVVAVTVIAVMAVAAVKVIAVMAVDAVTVITGMAVDAHRHNAQTQTHKTASDQTRLDQTSKQTDRLWSKTFNMMLTMFWVAALPTPGRRPLNKL